MQIVVNSAVSLLFALASGFGLICKGVPGGMAFSYHILKLEVHIMHPEFGPEIDIVFRIAQCQHCKIEIKAAQAVHDTPPL